MENGGWLSVCKVRRRSPRTSQMTQARGGAAGFFTKASERFQTSLLRRVTRDIPRFAYLREMGGAPRNHVI